MNKKAKKAGSKRGKKLKDLTAKRASAVKGGFLISGQKLQDKI